MTTVKGLPLDKYLLYNVARVLCDFRLLLLLLLLLLLAAMTYNQVQSFQVNNYANHNVDIEIIGYRELYSINCIIYVYVLLIHQEFMYNYPTSVI